MGQEELQRQGMEGGGSQERDRRNFRDRLGLEEGTGMGQEELQRQGREGGGSLERNRRTYRHRVGREEGHWNGTGRATGTGQG